MPRQTRPIFWWLLGGAGVAFLLSQTKQAQEAIMKVIGYVHGKVVDLELAPVGNGQYLRTDAAAAFLQMQAAARADGLSISAKSGFRSMEEQQALWNKYQAYLNGKGPWAATAAVPGTSNHQGGVAVDIQGEDMATAGFHGKLYAWLSEHAGEFGFDQGEGQQVKEPWHHVFDV